MVWRFVLAANDSPRKAPKVREGDAGILQRHPNFTRTNQKLSSQNFRCPYKPPNHVIYNLPSALLAFSDSQGSPGGPLGSPGGPLGVPWGSLGVPWGSLEVPWGSPGVP